MSLIDYKNIDIYQGDSLILKNVDFHVDEGEFMYIIGTVGSGKSSLLKTFYCELDIYHEDGKEGEKAEVKDNKEMNERIESVLTDVGMLDKIDKLPHELSGGEQQRVAIARAILNKPKIIIADEPTGNLDPETACKIISLLKNITTTGTAVVITTHNIPMLNKYPGIVYRCKNGVINDVTTEYNKMDLSEDAA